MSEQLDDTCGICRRAVHGDGISSCPRCGSSLPAPGMPCARCGVVPSSSPSEARSCDACGSSFHSDCWDENGGCGSYGCVNAAVHTAKPKVADSYWGEPTKPCPACRAEIPAPALICPYCGRSATTAERVATPSRRAGDVVDDDGGAPAGDLARGSVWLFVCGIIGVTAPFALFFGGGWYLRHRTELQTRGATWNLLAVVGLGVSALYSVLFLFHAAFFLFGMLT